MSSRSSRATSRSDAALQWQERRLVPQIRRQGSRWVAESGGFPTSDDCSQTTTTTTTQHCPQKAEGGRAAPVPPRRLAFVHDPDYLAVTHCAAARTACERREERREEIGSLHQLHHLRGNLRALQRQQLVHEHEKRLHVGLRRHPGDEFILSFSFRRENFGFSGLEKFKRNRFLAYIRVRCTRM